MPLPSPEKSRIAIIGDRGIPARYSGYSTLVEEVSVRLVADHGFDVTVYARPSYFEEHPDTYKGVRIKWLNAPSGKGLESIIHSNLSILHATLQRFDLVFVVDPGNGPFCLPLKLTGVPVVYHTDGLGWKRTKWSPLQQKYYKWSEKATAALANWLVTDSFAMKDYYQENYRAPSTYLPYGSVVGAPPSASILEKHGLKEGGFFLIVARMEPENNTELLIREYLKSKASRPLVVVGGVPYQSSYQDRVFAMACDRVKILGSVFDSGELNGLYRHCYAYLHGHEVGGTNPSLLRAMGAGAPIIPLNVAFNQEVVGWQEEAFTKEEGNLAGLLDKLDAEPDQVDALRDATLERSRRKFRWDAVASGYGHLFKRILELRQHKKPLGELSESEIYRPDDFAVNYEDWDEKRAEVTYVPYD